MAAIKLQTIRKRDVAHAVGPPPVVSETERPATGEHKGHPPVLEVISEKAARQSLRP